MAKYKYICAGCDNEIPELRVDNTGGFLHHTVGERQPEPCGPIGKVLIIEEFPMRYAFPIEEHNNG